MKSVGESDKVNTGDASASENMPWSDKENVPWSYKENDSDDHDDDEKAENNPNTVVRMMIDYNYDDDEGGKSPNTAGVLVAVFTRGLDDELACPLSSPTSSHKLPSSWSSWSACHFLEEGFFTYQTGRGGQVMIIHSSHLHYCDYNVTAGMISVINQGH